MKKFLFILFILLTIQAYSQNNFRDMSWGDSTSKLKSQYPDVKWQIETEDNLKAYSTEDYIAGYKVKVIYTFIANKLKVGNYYFIEDHSSKNLYHEDFIGISKILNKKYDMEKNEKWNDTSWKGDLDNIGHALMMGDVIITETYEDDTTSISHYISSDNYGGILHALIYYDMGFVNSQRDKVLDDF